MQYLLSTKIGNFMVGTGWLALLYFIYTGKISTTLIGTVAAAIVGGGGVHFIYQRTNGHSNGNGSTPPAAPVAPVVTGGSSSVQS